MPDLLVSFLRYIAVLLVGLLLQLPAGAAAEGLQVAGAAGLRDKLTTLGPALSNNQFKGPLYLESTESSKALQGDVYATVNFPFASVSAALNDAGHWCDVLILPFNVKQCRAKNLASGWSIELAIGVSVVACAVACVLAAMLIPATGPEYGTQT